MIERRARALGAGLGMGERGDLNGSNGRQGGGEPSVPRLNPDAVLPAGWEEILTADQWRLAVAAIGVARVEELRPMLAAVSPEFRESFVGHLARIAPGRKAGAAVLLALAQAADDARPDPEA
jgi:hypothetical protein